MNKGGAESVEARRVAMPLCAGVIDQLRQALGREFVDGQMAIAQAARREYAQVLASQGASAAARWHVANAHRCTFFAKEGDRSVGMPCPWGDM